MTIGGFLGLRCPVCEKAKVFRGYLDTPTQCPACGYFFLRETGYFLPHAAIGYVATSVSALAMWPIIEYGLGIQSNTAILAGMITVGIGFGVWSARYAKMTWVVIDLWLHPATQEDFEARGRDRTAEHR